MAYHSLLFIESCLIPSAEIFSGLNFFSVTFTLFCCDANSGKLFLYESLSTHFSTNFYIYLYDVAYPNKEFFRSLVLNFFASFYSTAEVTKLRPAK